jgi:histidinol-phosphate aminotransferase
VGMKDITTMLHLNEAPFAPASDVVKSVEISAKSLNRYPEWDGLTLRTALAKHYDVTADWLVVGGMGSIGIIQQVMVASGQGEVIYGWPSFEAFDMAAKALRMPIRHVPLIDNACDLKAYGAAITDKTSLIIVCTPNSPTGGIISQQELASFIESVPSHILVLIDEAYGEFVDDDLTVDALGLVRKHKNVLLTRTFSKAYGLAGARVGYAVAQPELAARIIGAGLPFPVPAPFEALALMALADQERLGRQVSAITIERRHLAEQLRQLGAEVVDGYGNFVWLPVSTQAEVVKQRLGKQGVMIKAVPGYGVRITIGTSEDTKAVCSAWQKAGLTEYLAMIAANEEQTAENETLPNMLSGVSIAT